MPKIISSQTILDYILSEGISYSKHLNTFLENHTLHEYIGFPLDHIALKARNAKQYEQLMNVFQSLAKNIWYIKMDNRRIGTVELTSPLILSPFKETHYVEILEPRPEKIGKDYVGFEHSEIYSQNLSEIETKALVIKLPYEKYENNAHSALVFKINQSGQEIKFTNTPHAEVLRKEVSLGLIKIFESK